MLRSEFFKKGTLAAIIVEVATVVDFSKPLREATYLLEGDGPLAFFVTEIIERANRRLLSGRSMALGNVLVAINYAITILEADPPSHPHVTYTEDRTKNWKEHAKFVSGPCLSYWNNHVMTHASLPLFEAAALANPHKMRLLVKKESEQREKGVECPSLAEQVRKLCDPLVGKLICHQLVDTMVDELPDYTEICNGIDWSNLSIKEKLDSIKQFWMKYTILESWREFYSLCLLLQPSSACVERAFSILKYIFDEMQGQSLQDKVELALQLRYNRATDVHTRDLAGDNVDIN